MQNSLKINKIKPRKTKKKFKEALELLTQAKYMLSPQVFHWMNATKKITGKSKEIILNCCEELLQNV